MSTSFTRFVFQFHLVSSSQIHSIAKHASLNLGVLCRIRPLASFHFSAIDYIQISDSSFSRSRILLPCLGRAPESSLSSLNKVQSKAIFLINNPNLFKYLHSLSHPRLVADLSKFDRYFHGNCSLHYTDIIPDTMRYVQTTRSPTQSHPFQVILPNPRTLSHKAPSIQNNYQPWSILLSSSFPKSYKSSCFKFKINNVTSTL